MKEEHELPGSKLLLVTHLQGLEVRHAKVPNIFPTMIGLGIATILCLVVGAALFLDHALSRGFQWLLVGAVLFVLGSLLWHQSRRPILFILNTPERALRYKTLWGYRTLSFSELQEVRVEGPRLRSYYLGPYYSKEWGISLRLVPRTGKRMWLFTSYHHLNARKDISHALTELRTLASMVNESLEQSR